MSIQSMASRAALRTAQGEKLLPEGDVVVTVRPTDAPATTVPSAPRSTTDAPAAPVRAATNGVTEYLKRVSDWIPAEAIGLFLGFATSFSVFDDRVKELGLAALVAVVSVFLATKATRSAHREMGLDDRGLRPPVGKVSVVTLAAFIAWWMATPGSLFTDRADLGWDAYWVAIVLAAIAFGLPRVAQIWGIEPIAATASNQADESRRDD